MVKNMDILIRINDIRTILLLCFILFLFSCTTNTTLEKVLDIAGDNRQEMIKALEHYKDDSLKYKAACFLMENMFHGYSHAAVMEDYRSEVMSVSLGKNQHDSIWLRLSKQQHPSSYFNGKFVYDSQIIHSDYLINNIDEAFTTWEASPWFKQVCFSSFCRYILPYRAKDEMVSDWRRLFREKYMPYIDGIETPEEAFVIIYNKVMTDFKKGNNLYPYPVDILMVDKIMKGSCDDRTLYLTCVLRALGIPATYDFVPYWANFTTSGHSWVAYIRNDSTFTLTHNEETLELYGTIDASRFYQKNQNYDIKDLSYNVDSVKRVGKVFRSTFELQQDRVILLKDAKETVPDLFKNVFQKDVSNQYGLFNYREMSTDCGKNIYLCVFVAGKNWQPIYVTKAKNSKVIFEHLNKKVVYLPCSFNGSEFIAIAPPFYMNDDNIAKEIVPHRIEKTNVYLKRKHVLTFHWTDRWSFFLGGKFEGSNFPDFRNKTVLHEINELPTGIEKINFSTPEKFRYIRFIARSDADPNFAEITFEGKISLGDKAKHKLNGKMIYDNIEEISLVRGMDGDNSTFFRITNTPGVPQKGYWFGYDLGANNKSYFTGVEYCPISDQNMIEPGDLYELFYFKNKWISLGTQIATENHLIYENVPKGALLWLRDHTKGREERIFTYENGRQVWW